MLLHVYSMQRKYKTNDYMMYSQYCNIIIARKFFVMNLLGALHSIFECYTTQIIIHWGKCGIHYGYPKMAGDVSGKFYYRRFCNI